MNMWTAVLALTEDMLAAAHAGNFDRVSALDAERHALINRPMVTDADTMRVLTAIVERDRAVVAIVEAARRVAGERLRQARLTQAGTGAYLGVAFAR
jgi:hypothetical protein